MTLFLVFIFLILEFYDLCEDEDENEAEQQSERNIDQEVESETGDEEEESSTEDLAPSIIASNGTV